jgi:hypothetical protein
MPYPGTNNAIAAVPRSMLLPQSTPPSWSTLSRPTTSSRPIPASRPAPGRPICRSDQRRCDERRQGQRCRGQLFEKSRTTMPHNLSWLTRPSWSSLRLLASAPWSTTLLQSAPLLWLTSSQPAALWWPMLSSQPNQYVAVLAVAGINTVTDNAINEI